ncbi:DUF2064 domain-containing protein [Phycicoccus endophyticus]|uniref:DUF2064 domain-containing protein n=2 Tax=Phycicoccus endophyticus TaxID=1690220 RepID=A0A7G9R696_9MICO|nr:DUF2064 domain-containing protein [Phycicoccus endophyticus]QNN51121.1 DUF2064 domain-containing protein [Phycicoccus endophyticus]GGL36437.1 hypothetical protein GCM10012283_18570 [Phycicoccus endophyticus]
MAKAPVPGRAKTRLAAGVGDEEAAELAAAALLDTVETAARVWPRGRRVLALAGDLAGATREAELRAAVADWHVVPQGGASFAQRLVDGHRQAHRLAGGPVVQVGMDTPQVTPAVLRGVATLAREHAAPVLGPALDGGWWVLVTTHPHQARVLAGVPMSRPDTGRLTAAALDAAGHPPLEGPLLRDVDELEDAVAVAAQAPRTRFARRWRELVRR